MSAIRRHPVPSYVLLAIAIAWGGAFMLLPAGDPGKEELDALLAPVFVAMALGPSLASVLLTAFLDGRAGIKALFGGLVRWRTGVGYYLLALVLVPATALLVLGLFSAFSPVFTPTLFGAAGGIPLLAAGVFVGLAAGLMEELGWTGFATRRLMIGRGVVAVGLTIGVLHGFWHLFVDYYWGDGTSYGRLFIPDFIVAWVLPLTALRLLIVWLFERTQSTLIAALTHASYTGALVMFWPGGISPGEEMLWTGAFAVALGGAFVALNVFGPKAAGSARDIG